MSKLDEVVTKENGYHMIVDLHEVNKIIEDLDFPIPKLDEVVHVVRCDRVFVKGDGTKGYRKFLLGEIYSLPLGLGLEF